MWYNHVRMFCMIGMGKLMAIRKKLLVVAVAALVSASCPAVSVVVDLPSPKPGPALAARIAAGDCEVYGIVHWGLNTYTDREWGYGDEDPALLNPAKFNADQIVGACKAGGLGGLIVVAKHHDGFCLWPTKTTEHNITKTPFWRGQGSVVRSQESGGRSRGRDYVKEMEQACRRAGLKFGVYVSPWDRHDADYASPKYVEKYHAQIKELLSGDYGEVFEMWFDGANGGDGWYGGAKERRRIAGDYYRFPEVFKFVRELQPKACIFAGESDDSDFRWPGNEKGELDPYSGATICTVGGFADGKYGNPEYGRRINRGMRNFENTAGHPMFFRVCECDFPMRPGWFYHAKEKGKTKSGIYLLKRYLNTVGNGGTMNLGIAPNKDGLLDDEDVKALADFGKLKAAFFSKPITNGLCNVVVMSEDVVNHGETCVEWLLYENDKKEPWDWQLDDGRKLAYGKNIVDLYNPLNYIGAEGTDAPVWTRIVCGAAEGDIAMFNSLNLEIAWLNHGTDAVIEWQWDGGHVPSETLGNSLALYVDTMYGEHVSGAVSIARPEAEKQTANGTSESASGTDLSAWVSLSEDGTVSFSLADLMTSYRTKGASKATPAFDVIDYGQEDYVFGSATKDARHWSVWVLKALEENAETLEALFN